MRIISDPKLDFDSCLILPKRSSLKSRSEVDLTRQFKFKHSPHPFNGIPIIAANMTGCGTIEMATVLNQHKVSVALHKHYSTDTLIQVFSQPHPYIWYSMGIGEADLKKFDEVKQAAAIQNVCIDVANGYSQYFVDFVKRFREKNPSVVIMAGNVVTPEITEELILAGADIVKVGIGPGCLTADARILMSNGTYKNIVDVVAGDEVITMKGTPAKVKRSFTTGLRKVMKIRNAHFHSPLYLTPDHKCYIGDLSSVSQETLWSRGYKSVLSSPTRFGESKLKWQQANALQQSVGLMPSTIQFSCPSDFSIDLQSHFKHSYFEKGYNKEITSSYDVGYLFGTFLGDGHAWLDDNYSGRVEWYFHTKETTIIDKVSSVIETVVGRAPTIQPSNKNEYVTLTLHSKQWASILSQFGKKSHKHLPEMFMCTNEEYLRGLYDGLIDSDGHLDNGIERLTNTSKQIIELFNFISLVLFKGCANVNKAQMQSSHLVTPVNEAHTSFIANTLEKRLINNFQAIKLLEVGEVTEIEVPVYDLEIDDETHSFIANNMIVHNSVCTTRIKTGIGYPQLSAIIECADAAHGLEGQICGDGGCRTPGDVAKAFGGGADFVMLGGMLAGHDESGGKVIGGEYRFKGLYAPGIEQSKMRSDRCGGRYFDTNMTWLVQVIGEEAERPVQGRDLARLLDLIDAQDTQQAYKEFPWAVSVTGDRHVEFYGMSSKTAQDKHNGGVADYRASEGKRVLVPYRGPVEDTLKEILGGVRSACTYVGARKLKELSKRTTFIMLQGDTHNQVFGDSISASS